jgi:DNA segregation ATPase FtsK/SpoIIIE-like protein
MATRRRTASPRRATGRSTGSARRSPSSGASSGPRISPDVARSLVGIAILVVGVITLVALILPGQGRLTDLWRNAVAPWMGAGRWFLPPLLIVSGIYVQQAKGVGGRWGVALIGALVAYICFLGLISLLNLSKVHGGYIGNGIESFLVGSGTKPGLIPRPAAFILLGAGMVGGILLAIDRSLPTVLAQLGRGARAAADTLAPPADPETVAAAAAAKAAAARGASRAVPVGPAPVPMRPTLADQPSDETRSSTRAPSPVPMSQTIWSANDGPRNDPGGGAGGTRPGGPAVLDPVGIAVGVGAGAVLGAGTLGAARATVRPDEFAPPEPLIDVRDLTWELPSSSLLEIRAASTSGGEMDHEENRADIEKKLRSFGIEAKVVAVNSGPVVTQYEVRPDARVKISRIEGLADDLAMALMARSIRIEAPIPGKDTVGIEIPNVKSETVDFRNLVDDTQMLSSTSRLTFALGRDVSGKAYAVDLAKMPHLLVAGATGSGKSVCVNALITSILMHARPNEVRLVLIDLKRVELAPYDALPHLLQHVIVEPHEAKAALSWAVHEMEERYKLLASHSVRNIAAYNEKVGPDEHLPYVVIIIDELADLIMREGRKVEDPIVKIAQKARAVGIHLVLATQRPSVNVVTGLIKANVPSRIAFAMASMIDSRTVLDSPGAEDLIGRGDMLYQPVDLPRPVRMQGVFVSDKEVSAVVDHWKAQAPEPFYDASLFAYFDGEDGSGGTQFAWLAKMAEDDMVVRAAELVTASHKASTSMLQTKLKVGFSRASRLMDELERYGIIGPQDLRNPAAPRIVYGPDNWLRSHDDIDDPGD